MINRVDVEFQEIGDSNARCSTINTVREKDNYDVSNDINDIIFLT